MRPEHLTAHPRYCPVQEAEELQEDPGDWCAIQRAACWVDAKGTGVCHGFLLADGICQADAHGEDHGGPCTGGPGGSSLGMREYVSTPGRSIYVDHLWGQVLRKHLWGTQGRPGLCFSGFSTYGEPNHPLSSIQPSGAIDETGPTFVTFLRRIALRCVVFVCDT